MCLVCVHFDNAYVCQLLVNFIPHTHTSCFLKCTACVTDYTNLIQSCREMKPYCFGTSWKTTLFRFNANQVTCKHMSTRLAMVKHSKMILLLHLCLMAFYFVSYHLQAATPNKKDREVLTIRVKGLWLSMIWTQKSRDDEGERRWVKKQWKSTANGRWWENQSVRASEQLWDFNNGQHNRVKTIRCMTLIKIRVDRDNPI